MSSEHPGAPSLYEIIILPILGAVAIEMFHTRQNELVMLFVPFLIVVIRLFIAQFQIPNIPASGENARVLKACRASIAWSQFAAFVLLFVEFAVVVAGGAGVPHAVGAIAAGFYVLYVSLRLLGRRFYIIAVTLALESDASPS